MNRKDHSRQIFQMVSIDIPSHYTVGHLKPFLFVWVNFTPTINN